MFYLSMFIKNALYRTLFTFYRKEVTLKGINTLNLTLVFVSLL